MPQYTAIISRNFRDTRLTTPKVLLRNIKDESGDLIRDHMWVLITKVVQDILPRCGDNQSYLVTFRAKPKTYQTDGPMKTTLVKIRDAEMLHKV